MGLTKRYLEGSGFDKEHEPCKICTKCKGIMVKGDSKKDFYYMKNGSVVQCASYDHMCLECGYIERYAEINN